MDPRDTICALSTAPGRSGIAVVRLSGAGCLELLRGAFRPERPVDSWPARRAMLGRLVDARSGEEIDEAIVTRFPGPHSYTGEDVAEISMHGSPVLIGMLLDSLAASGARLAEPGEFTMRAFLNGRMDLSQAEAVRDIIEAKTLYQAQVAARQRGGEISRQLRPVKDRLTEIIVNLESAVEFVEESLPTESRAQLAEKLDDVRTSLGESIGSFRRGRIIHDGFSLAIVGCANVGKSSLFNALLAEERSIVTELPGTTRDLVSELTSIDGIPVRLADTAGMRPAEDKAERLGIERSLRAIADADAVLLVVDTSRPPSPADEDLRKRLEGQSFILVMNKADLPMVWSAEEMAEYAAGRPAVFVSALVGTNIEGLKQRIRAHLFGEAGTERDGILVTNVRHCRCLEAAQEALGRAAAGLNRGISEEYVLVDLHAGLRELGAITGETSVEDLLSAIFSRFCVGK